MNNDLRERTYLFARRIYRLFNALPNRSGPQTIGKQLLRSGTSVGANYLEANRARSRAEFISTLGICLRESEETVFWLKLMRDEQILEAQLLEPIIQEASELIAIFTTSIKTAKSGKQNNI